MKMDKKMESLIILKIKNINFTNIKASIFIDNIGVNETLVSNTISFGKKDF